MAERSLATVRRGWGFWAGAVAAVLIALGIWLSAVGPTDAWPYLWSHNQGRLLFGGGWPAVTLSDEKGKLVATTDEIASSGTAGLTLAPGKYFLRNFSRIEANPVGPQIGPNCNPGRVEEIDISRGATTKVPAPSSCLRPAAP